MADEAKIKNLETMMDEKLYLINECQNKFSIAEKEVRYLKDEIEKERRKSMADQAKIAKLEGLLKDKVQAIGRAAEKHRQADD